MTTKVDFMSKTQIYLKVKKPLLERQRRARINKCLDTLKTLVAEFQNDDAILRMDKAEMLEATTNFMREISQNTQHVATPTSMDGFRNGYINAAKEVSRMMAAMPGMNIEIGKSVMTSLGCELNRMLKTSSSSATKTLNTTSPPLSPASSGYCSDNDETYQTTTTSHTDNIWRPW